MTQLLVLASVAVVARAAAQEFKSYEDFKKDGRETSAKSTQLRQTRQLSLVLASNLDIVAWSLQTKSSCSVRKSCRCILTPRHILKTIKTNLLRTWWMPVGEPPTSRPSHRWWIFFASSRFFILFCAGLGTLPAVYGVSPQAGKQVSL